MAKLWLVRHGQAGAVDGDYDKLSTLGERQAQLLGEYFKQRELHFDVTQSGTLKRQISTLNSVLEHCTSAEQLTKTAALNELPFQQLAQCWAEQQQPRLTAAPLANELSRVLRSTLTDWIGSQLYNEPLSWANYRKDAVDWLENLREQYHSADNLLVISSGGTIGTLMASIVEAPDLSMLHFNLQLRNTGVCEIELGRRRSHLISFNNLPHLDSIEDGGLMTLI